MSDLEEQAKEADYKRDYDMEIVLDNGVYRHLRFRHDNSIAYGFDLVTWPGYLSFSGDMGCYVFSRINDMIEFFHGEGINPGYWAEKVKAESIYGDGLREFDFDHSLSQCVEYLKYHDFDDEFIEEFEAEFQYVDNDEFGFISKFRELYTTYHFDDFWPTDDYTFQYYLACHCIQRGCNMYMKHVEDQAKS